ncbi:isoprenoid biosynthesis glyoxalase ElbB, partial [bacterium]|nr:isoprenoid biosynthesis glyoxalase ElbB [bacterium]
TEAVSTLIGLTQLGAQYEVFAPDAEFSVTDPLSGQSTGEKRNALTESARIARGKVRALSEMNETDFDGLVFPGGFGAALILSDWALKGSQAHVLLSVDQMIKAFYKASKPIAAFCIAPALLAKTLGSEGVTLTIGQDRETALEIEKTGAHHEDCAVDDFITDRAHKIVTSPAYMYDDAKPSEVFAGISKALKEFVEMS